MAQTEEAAASVVVVYTFAAEQAKVKAREANTWQIVKTDGEQHLQFARKVGAGFYAEAGLGPGLLWLHVANLSGTFGLWIKARPNATGDSIFFEWENDSADYHWSADAYGQRVWLKLRRVELLANHRYAFAIWAREDLIEVDQVLIQSAGAPEPGSSL